MIRREKQQKMKYKNLIILIVVLCFGAALSIVIYQEAAYRRLLSENENRRQLIVREDDATMIAIHSIISINNLCRKLAPIIVDSKNKAMIDKVAELSNHEARKWLLEGSEKLNNGVPLAYQWPQTVATKRILQGEDQFEYPLASILREEMEKLKKKDGG